jgi:hypothetical protein
MSWKLTVFNGRILRWCENCTLPIGRHWFCRFLLLVGWKFHLLKPKQRYHENCSATKTGNSTILFSVYISAYFPAEGGCCYQALDAMTSYPTSWVFHDVYVCYMYQEYTYILESMLCPCISHETLLFGHPMWSIVSKYAIIKIIPIHDTPFDVNSTVSYAENVCRPTGLLLL